MDESQSTWAQSGRRAEERRTGNGRQPARFHALTVYPSSTQILSIPANVGLFLLPAELQLKRTRTAEDGADWSDSAKGG